MGKDARWLFDNVTKANIAKDLSDDTLKTLSEKVRRGFEIDELSRKEWCDKTEAGLKIAEQITEKKTTPWPDAANVKFPLIATASIQFAARAYPNILQGQQVVKTKVVGEDADGSKAKRAVRVSQHMSYQCTDEMEGWEEGVDKLLHSLPVIGTCFKKTYFSSLLQRNVSEFVSPLDLVVNNDAQSLDSARRVTHKIYLYKNDVIERERDELFIDHQADYMETADDEDKAECFLEQHCWADLDEDGYEEPYIITIHESSGTLVRVVARYEEKGISLSPKQKVKKIQPLQYFTMFGFIPAPSGKFYYLGFAHLLGPINESINTVINQLLDAGTLSNMQSGFLGKGIRFQGGALRFKPGEWKTVDVTGGVLKDNIFPLPTKEPSNVLFMLLGLLNETGMKLASVSESMTGEAPPQNTPAATTLAMIEQGLKVFTAIYKRVYRSLTAEYRKLYRLNGLYLDDKVYFNVMDTQVAVSREDYNSQDFNVFPIADPSLASEAQKIAKSQALMATIQINPSPAGKMEILKQHYEAIGAENLEKILPEAEIKKIMSAPQPPDPKLLETELKTVQSKHEGYIKDKKLPYELALLQEQIEETKARTAKLSAEAAAVPILNQLQALESMVDRLHNETKLEIERIKAEKAGGTDGGASGAPASAGGGDSGGVEAGAGGMAEPPDDEESSRLSGPDPQEMVERYGLGGDAEPGVGGADGAGNGLPVGPAPGFEPGVEP